jgi:hypothetical protein
MKKIQFILVFLMSVFCFSQTKIPERYVPEISESMLDSGLTDKINSSTIVTDLAQLQAVVDGTSTITRLVNITGNIDLVNTDVTLTNVHLVDGGGSIVTSGTGVLKLEGNSKVDNTILNASLNWDATSVGNLINPILTFNTSKYPIDETISDTISFSDVDAGIIAATKTNIDNINKAITDAKLFGGNELYISRLDCFINNAKDVAQTWYEKNLNEQHLFSIILPSDFTIRMTDSVFIRSLPTYTYAQHIISSLDTKNVNVIGGNLIGSRLSHNYRQYRRIYTASTASSIDYTIGENDDLVTYTIPITPNSAETQVQEISDYINASAPLGALGYSSTWGTNAGHWYFDVSNSTDGVYFRAYGETTNGYTEYLSGYDITYELAIAFIGVDGGTVDGTVLRDCYGDGFLVAGNGLSSNPDFRNSRNITIKNCTIDNNRRNNISPIGVNTMLIENNYIINAGQVMGVNDGSAPRLGIDTEPTRSRDPITGITDDNNIVRGVIVRNNYMLDNLYGAINLFSAYDSWAINNVTNNRIAAYKETGGGIVNNIIDFRLTLGGEVSSLGQRAIETFASIDTYTTKVEIASRLVISGNQIIGRGADATLSEMGMRLMGWKINCHDNIIHNINGVAFSLSQLRESNIHHNIVDNEPAVINSRGLDITSTAVRDVHFDYNNIRVYERPIELNNINTSAQAATIGMVAGVPSLFLTGNSTESYNTTDRIISAYSVTLTDNLFKSGFEVRNNVYDTHFKGNKFIKRLFLNASSVLLDNCSFIDNDIHSTTTSAAFEFKNTGASVNNIIAGNRLYQPSGGDRALYVYLSGGSVNGFKIYDNTLISGSPTEFITFFGDASFFLNNWDIPALSATIQTITGTGNAIGEAESILTKTVDYTTALTDDIILVDATAGDVIITLTTPVGNSGKTFTVKKIDSTANTVTVSSSAGIDGTTTKVYSTQYSGGTFQSNGTQYFITSNF